MTCCEHCTYRRTPEEAEAEQFAESVRAIRSRRRRADLSLAARATTTIRVVVSGSVDAYRQPLVQPPTTPSPDRPRGA